MIVFLLLSLGLMACGELPTPETTTTMTPRPSPRLATPTAGTPGSARAIGGDLLSAEEREPTTFQPYGPADPVSQRYRSLLYNAKLLRRNPQTLEWEGQAAQSFKYDDATRSLTFELRDNIKWSDGQPITAADYAWTYSQALDTGKSWTNAATFAAAIESYSAPDSRTLLVKLRGRYSDPLELANFVEPLPKHVWGDKSWSEPDKNSEILRPSVVSGQWKFKTWIKKERVTFERNEASSVLPPPYLNSLTFLYIPDSRQAVAMLARGELDFYVPPADRYVTMRDAAKVITYRWNSPTPDWSYLGFNFRRTLPADPAFRHALAAVTDRAALIKNAADGHAVAQYSDVPPGHPAYTAEVEKYSGGIEQARLLLRVAGYTQRPGDGRLLDSQGRETPELSLLFNIEGSERGRVAAYFKEQLSRLGVAVRLVPLDYLTYIDRLKQPMADFDLWLGGWKPLSPDLARFGQQIWRNNLGGYNHSELTSLYDRAAQEPDQPARNLLLTQIQQFQARELPYLYLYAEQNYLGALFPVGGVEEGPLGPRYDEWYIRQ